MEPEGSLPPSQEPSTGPYPEPDRSNPHQKNLHSSVKYLELPKKPEDLNTTISDNRNLFFSMIFFLEKTIP
jgi:hypothetical protein